MKPWMPIKASYSPTMLSLEVQDSSETARQLRPPDVVRESPCETLGGARRQSEVAPPFRRHGDWCSFKATGQWRGTAIVLGQKSHDQCLSSTQNMSGVGRSCRGIWGRNGRLEESQKKSNGERSHHG